VTRCPASAERDLLDGIRKILFAKLSLRFTVGVMTSSTPPPLPAEVVRPDASSLRALAHPLRLQLLGLLRSDGPATASQLGVRTGQSSGATSYHLRQLAQHGFVVDDDTRGNGRDRWWRAAHRSTQFDVFPDADEESAALGEQYLRVVAGFYARRLDAAIAALPTLEGDLGDGWQDAFTMSDLQLRLTRDEALAMIAELEEIAARYRHDNPETRTDAPGGAERVVLQFQVLPVVPAPAPDEEPSA
jgi:DNA-binding transcriptional ArsR family regulator